MCSLVVVVREFGHCEMCGGGGGKKVVRNIMTKLWDVGGGKWRASGKGVGWWCFWVGKGGGQEKKKSRWSDVQCEVHLATTSEPPV